MESLECLLKEGKVVCVSKDGDVYSSSTTGNSILDTARTTKYGATLHEALSQQGSLDPFDLDLGGGVLGMYWLMGEFYARLVVDPV